MCKHRSAILRGDVSEVEGGDIDRAYEIKDMLSGTKVESALTLLAELEANKAALDKQIRAQKKVLNRALED